MDILKRYETALELYHKRKFAEALKIVEELKAAAPSWLKSFLLEAYVRREQGEFVKEFYLLTKLLPQCKLDKPEDKQLAADALSLFGSVNRVLGNVAESVESFKLSAMLEGGGGKSCIEISNALFAANSAEEFSPDEFRALYAEYKKYLADVKPYPRRFYKNERIRVGFLSADFQWHVVMSWSWALLTELNRKKFEVYCYSGVKRGDSVTRHIRSTANVWRDISSLSDAEAAQVIRDDEIDILFDLSGHTADNRLRVAAYQPASVQVSGIGYMNSTGLDGMDYFLTDVYCAGDTDYFTEKLIVLPHSHICYEPPIKNLEPAESPPCFKNGYVTFGSFNQFGKVTNSILNAWQKILDEVPDSRLILKHKIFKTTDGRDFVRERLRNCGVDLSRVEMRPYSANHLLEYGDVDIALDTFPYVGGVTTCEALYMGVPVVSLYGDRHGTRFGLSILANVGLGELAVDTYEDYIKRATALAGDWALLRILRKNLRGMMRHSRLMDSTSYVHEVEAVFIKIARELKM